MTEQATRGIITLSGLSFSYNGAAQNVLNGLSLAIPEGTVTAILGPNGSGKTTLLRLLLGVLRSQEGRIEVAGRPQGRASNTVILEAVSRHDLRLVDITAVKD